MQDYADIKPNKLQFWTGFFLGGLAASGSFVAIVGYMMWTGNYN